MRCRPIAKLLIPQTPLAIARPRVSAAVARALRDGACWLAAPAGYGKTTALAGYLREGGLTHIWYRVDEDDQDIAGFFHYLAQTLPTSVARHIPVFGPEYADQPLAFARRFFRSYFAALRSDTLLVLDDLHCADTPQFHTVLSALLQELPPGVRCACLSRTLPPPALNDLVLSGRLPVIDHALLVFSDKEARSMLRARRQQVTDEIDIAAARGWAVGLALLSQGAIVQSVTADPAKGGNDALFAVLQQQLFDALPQAERSLLLRLSQLPEISGELATALADDADNVQMLLAHLQQRQMLTVQNVSGRSVFLMHDLMRDFLRGHLQDKTPAPELAALRARIADLLARAGQTEAAIDLALRAGAHAQARGWIAACADTLLAQGRRALFVEWCMRLPADALDAWLCYWMGVAHMADDATAEQWLSRAWQQFETAGDARGLCLTAARAVLAKADSWRTHQGLAQWTQRALHLLDAGLPPLQGDEELLALTGLVRTVDFAEIYRCDSDANKALTQRLLARLQQRRDGDSMILRLLASASLIEQAGATARADVFAQAVDSVANDLDECTSSPWALGLWLVAFGTACGRYFPYARRGFPYADAEQALRAAVAIGEREQLRGVEFGALYHLQLLIKLRGELTEFEALIERLAQVADSRYSTQYGVLADCQAALHTLRGDRDEAERACARVIASIKAAHEPPIECWPHYITHFQVLLLQEQADKAARYLEALAPQFDAGVRQRTDACIGLARALEAKWRHDSSYPQRLHEALAQLHAVAWTAALSNLPTQLAELCADALAYGIETDFCRQLIMQRHLPPPAARPAHWPWPLAVHVLGEFHLTRAGVRLELGAKPPTRALDIIRMLAISTDHTCALDILCDRLWPDADGDKAKAACEQSLHRLRKWLGDTELVVQREGKLRLARERVWVDLEDWESRLAATAAHGTDGQPDLARVFFDFPGALLQHEPIAPWALAATERVRRQWLDLANRLARALEAREDHAGARAVHLRALEIYPDSVSCYEALIRLRLAQGDRAGALDDYARYQRLCAHTTDPRASAAIGGMIMPLLKAAPMDSLH